jgi:hypothetical protein
VPGETVNYVREVATRVRTLITREIAGAAVYAGDPERIPAFGPGGTFAVEAAASGVEAGTAYNGYVAVTLRIWTYADGDGDEAEEAVSAAAQRLEAVLFAAKAFSLGEGALKLKTEYLRTDYLTREKGRAFRRRRVRAGRTEWRVRLAARR